MRLAASNCKGRYSSCADVRGWTSSFDGHLNDVSKLCSKCQDLFFFNPLWESILFERRGGWLKRTRLWAKFTNSCKSNCYTVLTIKRLFPSFQMTDLTTVRSPTFNGYVTYLTPLGRLHNRRKVRSLIHFHPAFGRHNPILPSLSRISIVLTFYFL